MTEEEIKQARENAESGAYHGAEKDVLAALDEIEALKYIIRMCKNCDGNARAAELEQERDQLKSKIAELEGQLAEQHEDYMAVFKDMSHQRKRAEAWREAALRAEQMPGELSSELPSGITTNAFQPAVNKGCREALREMHRRLKPLLDRARAIEGEER